MTTTFDMEVLSRFAEASSPKSRWELFGDSNIARTLEAVEALVRDGLLEALPHETHCDRHGGHQFRVTGRAASTAGTRGSIRRTARTGSGTPGLIGTTCRS